MEQIDLGERTRRTKPRILSSYIGWSYQGEDLEPAIIALTHGNPGQGVDHATSQDYCNTLALCAPDGTRILANTQILRIKVSVFLKYSTSPFANIPNLSMSVPNTCLNKSHNLEAAVIAFLNAVQSTYPSRTESQGSRGLL
jgi:hypothetical protein